MAGMQLIALALGFGAIHLTHLYYKRSHFSKKELIFWGLIWCSFIAVTIFPAAIVPFSGYFGLARPMDFVMIAAFIILFSLGFHNYVALRKHEREIEHIVRAAALRDGGL